MARLTERQWMANEVRKALEGNQCVQAQLVVLTREGEYRKITIGNGIDITRLNAQEPQAAINEASSRQDSFNCVVPQQND